MSKSEERARRREERLDAERKAETAAKRRMALAYIGAGGLVLAILVGLVVALGSGDEDSDTSAQDLPGEAFIEPLSGSDNGLEPDGRAGTPPPELAQGDLEESAQLAGCELQLDLTDEGNTHLREGQKPPDYKTDPPTSGNHIVPPLQQADGAYAEYPQPVNTVHSLEHGRVVIQYSPDLPEEEQLEIKGVFDEDPAGLLLFPNPDMPYDVAVTGWTQLMGCDGFAGAATLDAIRNMRDIYRGNGPEPVPIQLAG